MKYAVIYQSKSGNTEKIAGQIYDSLNTDAKQLINIDNDSRIPDADVYFVGFGVHNNSCSMDVEEILGNIRKGKVALFATCGFLPEVAYKEQIENAVKEKLDANVDYLGMFLCQGRIEDDRKNIMLYKMHHSEKTLREIFHESNEHPNTKDMQDAREFVVKLAETLRLTE